MIIGNAISNDLLQQMSQGLDKDIVALNQQQAIASTLENAHQIQWRNLLVAKRNDRPVKQQQLYIQQQAYIAKTVMLSGLANAELELLLLSPLDRLHRAQQHLWMVVGVLSFLGVAIATIIGYWIAGAIARPIRKITDATAKISGWRSSHQSSCGVSR
jgi:hypothetical protein